MTTRQRIELRQSEVRQRLNALAGQDKLTAEETAEVGTLTTEHSDLEVRFRAAVIAEGDSQDQADADLNTDDDSPANRIEIRAYVESAITGGDITGAERELNGELKLAAGVMPLDALEDRTVTPIPSDSGERVRSIAGRVFATTAAARAGFQFPTVPVGESVFPIMATGATPAYLAKSGQATAPAGSITTTKLEPRRVSGALEIQVEDLASLVGFEDAIRADIRGAIAEGIDAGAIGGDGTAPEPTGIMYHGTNPTAPATGNETFARYRTAYLEAVSARYGKASAIVVGETTFQQAGGVYRGNNADVSGLDAIGGEDSIILSPHVPAVAANIQRAVWIRPGILGYAPVWRGIQLIRDNVTKARNGVVVITGIALTNSAVTNANLMVRDAFRVS